MSSTGKSTAEMLMCSPFMNPEISNKADGLCFTANNTQNALFARIEGIFGVPFVIDDITTNPHINLSQFIYILADGTNKGRLNGDSQLIQGGFGWSGVAITSSETPILDFAAKYQGLRARVIQTQGIQWTKSATEAELIKRTVRKNYGFTGKEFALYVSGLPIDILSDRYYDALDEVKLLMKKKDNLTDRLASKFAAIYLTIELLNEAFVEYDLSAHDLISRLIKCEQETFEERNPALMAYNCIIDFITRFQSHFITERKFSNPYYNFDDMNRPNEVYGKIIKSDSEWEVYLIEEYTKKILSDNGYGGEIRGIRQKWIENDITKGDNDHNTRQYTIAGKRARCDCFRIKGGIREPDEEVAEQHVEQIETPVSNYEVDDSDALSKLLGGQNADRD